jgi:hypothetical protein
MSALKMKTGKNKGSKFELETACFLTKLTGHTFVRSHLKTKDSYTEKGDLFCEKYKNIVIECKSYKEPLTFSELFNDANRFTKWINILKDNTFIIFIKTNHAGVIYFTNSINVLIELNMIEFGYKKLDWLFFNKVKQK